MIKHSLIPLVVDLDDTLILTDSLHENIISLVKEKPAIFPRLPFLLKEGKAKFKEYVYKNSSFSVETLPYRMELVNYLRAERDKGREIILATAAYEGIATDVANYLGCFDKVLATNKNNNLRGDNKLRAIQSEVGDDFVYAGDHNIDLSIWSYAKGAIICGSNTDELSKQVSKLGIPIEALFINEKPTLKIWLKAIRIHQWIKNILIFIPLLMAFQFYEIKQIFQVLIAFFAFSLGASATYILNDLWDLNSDRQHKRKCKRPFAASIISIPSALKASMLLLGSGMLLSLYVSTYFFLIFLLYLIITTVYSLKFKKEVLVDIIILSLLYTIRIIAGGIVSNIFPSYWLITFSILIFLSLATIKRCGELVSMSKEQKSSIVGRGYTKGDLDILWPLGVSSYIGAVIVFGLYINEPSTTILYAYPSLLWLVQLILFYMIGNLWIKTKHGLMHDDPIVFLIKDQKSLLLLSCMGILLLFAHYGF